MQGEDSGGAELAAVEGEGLAGEEVRRHRVPREGVDDEQVEAAVGLAVEGPPRIVDHDACRAPAVGEKREPAGVGRDRGDGRVDLVEGELIPRPRIAGDRADPEAGHAHPVPRAQRVEAGEHAAQGPRRVVVGQGNPAPVGITAEQLHAVADAAVHEDVRRPVRRRADAQHAEERPLALQDLPRRLTHEERSQHQAAESQRPLDAGQRRGRYGDHSRKQGEPAAPRQGQPGRRQEDAREQRRDEATGGQPVGGAR